MKVCVLILGKRTSSRKYSDKGYYFYPKNKKLIFNLIVVPIYRSY